MECLSVDPQKHPSKNPAPLLQATVMYSLKTCSLWNEGQENRNLRVKKPCGLLRKFPLCDETGEKPNYHFADNDQNRLINSKEIDRP